MSKTALLVIMMVFFGVSLQVVAQVVPSQTTSDNASSNMDSLALNTLMKELNVTRQDLAEVKKRVVELDKSLTSLRDQIVKLYEVNKTIEDFDRLANKTVGELDTLRRRVNSVNSSVVALRDKVFELDGRFLPIYALLAASLVLNVVAIFLFLRRRREGVNEIC